MAVPVATSPPASVSPMRQLWIKSIIFCALIIGAFAACFFIQPPAKLSEAGVVMSFPEQVLDFTGKDEPVSEGERVLLPPDTEFAKKLYTDSKGGTLHAEIVLSGVEHRSIHRPEACLRGQGWNIPNGEIMSVPLKSGRNLDVMVLDITHPFVTPSGVTIEQRALYAYFFVSKDAETPKHLERIAITNLDLLLHNKSHRWAYVIAMVPFQGDRTAALQTIKDFLRESAPQFIKSEIASGKS